MTRFAFLSLAVALGCSVDHTGLGPATDGGIGPGFDGGPGFDAGPRPDSGPRRDAGPVFDGGPGFDGGACTFTARCSTDGLRVEECAGGVVSDKECPVRCDPAGPVCLDLSPSNGLGEFLNVAGVASTDLSLTWPGAYEDGSEVWDTDNCEALPGSKGVHDPGGGVSLCVLVFDDFRLQGMLRVDGSRGLAIVAQGSITIAADSALRLDARGQRGGAGGGVGASTGTMAGGPHPGSNGRHARDWDDGGGGGGGNGANGGSGGNGDSAMGGAGGTAAGGALDPVHGGSGGGAGGTGGNTGNGGGGGGVLVLVAREGVTLDGYLDVSGSGGFGGRSFDDANWGAGGGGGSGGSIVIETAGALTRGATGAILASGGGGGGGALCGGNGQDGRQELPDVTASGGDGPTCVGLSNGGDGGDGGEMANGERGGDRNVGSVGGNGGGGGGGPGLIVIRAQFPDTTPFGRSGIYQTGAPNYVVVE